MKLEFVRRRVPRCSRLEAFDVAAVAQLALGIAPDDVVTQRLGHPKFVLCGRALLADRCRCTTLTISQMTLGERERWRFRAGILRPGGTASTR